MSYRNFTLYGGPLDGLVVSVYDWAGATRSLVVGIVEVDGVWGLSTPGYGQSSAIYRRQGDRLVYAPPRKVCDALDSQTLAVPRSVVDIQR